MKKITWKKYENDFLPSERDIQRIEEKIDFTFPNDFIDIMKENDGGYPDICTFELLDDEDCINNLLSFDESDKQSIVFAYSVLCRYGIKNLIPIARDPFGNYICYKKMELNNSKIVFWDHEAPDKIIDLCGSFSEFLNMLYS